MCRDYVLISQQHIMPGVNLVNHLILSNGEDTTSAIGSKVREINSYARNAQSAVTVIANNRRQRIENQFKDMEQLHFRAQQDISNKEHEFEVITAGGYDEEEVDEGDYYEGDEDEGDQVEMTSDKMKDVSAQRDDQEHDWDSYESDA